MNYNHLDKERSENECLHQHCGPRRSKLARDSFAIILPRIVAILSIVLLVITCNNNSNNLYKMVILNKLVVVVVVIQLGLQESSNLKGGLLWCLHGGIHMALDQRRDVYPLSIF